MMMGSPGSPASPLQSQFLPGYLLGDTTQHAVSVRFNIFFFLLYWAKDLYSTCRKDTNLVFSRFISSSEVLCYNRAKINSFIL
jgi:hypothetical protein